MPSDVIAARARSGQVAFMVKWAASVIQILGYSATAFRLAPWNAYLFLCGLLGWLAVGLLWRDRALILIHSVALCVMVAGLAS